MQENIQTEIIPQTFFFQLEFLRKIPILPNLPNISTPRAAKIKKSRKKSRPRFPTWGNACITVSNRARIPLAILSNLRTEIIIVRIWCFTKENILKTNICWILEQMLIYTSCNSKNTHNPHDGWIYRHKIWL